MNSRESRRDIYILRLIKRLCSIGGLFSRLRRKAYGKMMVHSLYIGLSAVFYLFLYYNPLK